MFLPSEQITANLLLGRVGGSGGREELKLLGEIRVAVAKNILYKGLNTEVKMYRNKTIF